MVNGDMTMSKGIEVFVYHILNTQIIIPIWPSHLSINNTQNTLIHSDINDKIKFCTAMLKNYI